MLTPQDIQSKEFAKAVFGGYDMSAVDDFLEELAENYTTLYKENAILKGKIKVLVEKVEEYRSTEDAMRMALLTAQKMGDDIVQEAGQKRDEMLDETQKEIDQKRQNFSKEYADEAARLETAKAQTLKFVQASREIMTQHGEFLSRLDEITSEFGGMQTSQPEPDVEAEPEHEPARSPEPEISREAAPAETLGKDLDDTIRGIDAFVSDVLEHGGTEEEPEAAAETVRVSAKPQEETDDSVDDSPTRRIEWTDEDEITTPRPKFDFKNLKFGSNYFDE